MWLLRVNLETQRGLYSATSINVVSGKRAPLDPILFNINVLLCVALRWCRGGPILPVFVNAMFYRYVL